MVSLITKEYLKLDLTPVIVYNRFYIQSSYKDSDQLTLPNATIQSSYKDSDQLTLPNANIQCSYNLKGLTTLPDTLHIKIYITQPVIDRNHTIMAYKNNIFPCTHTVPFLVLSTVRFLCHSGPFSSQRFCHRSESCRGPGWYKNRGKPARIGRTAAGCQLLEHLPSG